MLTLDHPNLTEPLRFSTDNAQQFEYGGEMVRGTISNGYNYVHFPVTVVLPTDEDGTISKASIAICNVTKEIMRQVRLMQDSPIITMQVVVASTPNVVEAIFTGYKFTNISGDAFEVTGDLDMSHFMNEPYPGDTILPSNYPGCY